MHSLVSARRVVEWALRVVGLAILCVFLMRAWSWTTDRRVLHSTQAALGQALAHWTLSTPASVHVSLDSVLAPEQRDWLAAIARSKTHVTWDAPAVAATAASISRVADPAGASELNVVAPESAMVLIRQPNGALDSVSVGRIGAARVVLPGSATDALISVGTTTAHVAPPDSIIFRRLLVEGAASWETRFTIAALAERGWKIDAVTHVAPGVDVREGEPESPDTARYAALIAVDSTASLIARGAAAYVRSGGGLLTLSAAAAIGPRGRDPIVLERGRDGDVRAFRVENGRVIRVAYADLWRQRMHGDDTVPDPVAAHRAWLARAVASVAYAPRANSVGSGARNGAADPAPLADMVARLGPRSGGVPSSDPFRTEVPSSVLFGIMLAAFLLEWASRRLRGAK